MITLRRVLIGIAGIIAATLMILMGVGSGGPLPYGITVTVAAPATAAPPASSQVALPCPGNQPGPVDYYGNDPAAAKYHSFGIPIVDGLSPTYEPYSPEPDRNSVVTEMWKRLCHDPVLARATVAASYPTWEGLKKPFDWTAALQLIAQGNWSTSYSTYKAEPPTPWTMSMVASPTGGPPQTLIVHAPWQGWYHVVRFGNHTVLFRLGCGGQPALDMQGYHAPLAGIFSTPAD